MKTFLGRRSMKNTNIYERLRKSSKLAKTGQTERGQVRELYSEKLCGMTFLKLSLCWHIKRYFGEVWHKNFYGLSVAQLMLTFSIKRISRYGREIAQRNTLKV
jgi:hypothetical protein